MILHIDNDIGKPRVTAILIAHHREARECLKQHPPLVQFYRAYQTHSDTTFHAQPNQSQITQITQVRKKRGPQPQHPDVAGLLGRSALKICFSEASSADLASPMLSDV